MRNLLLIALFLGFFAGTSKTSFEVKVKLVGSDGKAYLTKRHKGEWVKLDSVALVNGEGVFKGVVKNPETYYLSLNSKRENLQFFIENSTISIVGSADSLAKAKVTGSEVQDEYQALQDKLGLIEKQGSDIYNLSKDAKKAGQKAKADSLMALAEKSFDEIASQQKAYIKANPSSYVSANLLGRIYYDMEADVLDGFLLGFDAKLDSVPTILTLKERVAKLKLVAVGQIAPDFTMSDVSGNPLKLSDVYSKNEYTLIDFWASWCGPCRHENPNVVAVFNAYKTKGFGVFGVSFDNDKSKWEKAIADDQLVWQHVSDLKGWKCAAGALYSVNSIPANILVDKTGKIIGRNLREAKLGETIGALLK